MMRTILVPIDFSVPAYNAALYALEMAKRLQAALHLFHVIEAVDKALLDAQIIWPIVNYDDLKAKAVDNIHLFQQRLEEHEARNIGSNKVFITCSLAEGVVHQEIDKEIHRSMPILLVAGMHGAGNARRFIFGSKSRDLIAHVYCPILLIPNDFTYRTIHKIAFATDLSQGDIDLIELLTVFAKPFDAEILIGHIGADTDDTRHEETMETFLHAVTCKNNDDKIYYRYIPQKNIENGILWLTENGQIDVLTMVHRPRGILNELLRGSRTKQIAKRIAIPLLVLKH